MNDISTIADSFIISLWLEEDAIISENDFYKDHEILFPDYNLDSALEYDMFLRRCR
jgi:hypothetical protein